MVRDNSNKNLNQQPRPLPVVKACAKLSTSKQALYESLLHAIGHHDVVTLLKVSQTSPAAWNEVACELWRALLAPDCDLPYDKHVTDILCASLALATSRRGLHREFEGVLEQVFAVGSYSDRSELVGHLLADKRFLQADKRFLQVLPSSGQPRICQGSPAVTKALDNVLVKGDPQVLVLPVLNENTRASLFFYVPARESPGGFFRKTAQDTLPNNPQPNSHFSICGSQAPPHQPPSLWDRASTRVKIYILMLSVGRSGPA
jgi:hypothetical protein